MKRINRLLRNILSTKGESINNFKNKQKKTSSSHTIKNICEFCKV